LLLVCVQRSVGEEDVHAIRLILCIRRVSQPGGTQMYSCPPSLSHHSSGQATKAVIIRRVSPNRCPTLPHHRHRHSLTHPRHKVPTTRACNGRHASCLQVISSCMLQCCSNSSSRAYSMTADCPYSEQRYGATRDIVRSIEGNPSRLPPETLVANRK
jgi:hypothetical protein